MTSNNPHTNIRPLANMNLATAQQTSPQVGALPPIPVHAPVIVQPNNINANSNTGPRMKGQISYSPRTGIPASTLSGGASPSASHTTSARQQESSSEQKQKKKNEEAAAEEEEEETEETEEKENSAEKANTSKSRRRTTATTTSTSTGSRRTSKSSAAATTSRRRTSANTTTTTGKSTVRTKRQATGVVVQVATSIPSSRVTRRRTKIYELRGHWGQQDEKGTRWLKKVPEDRPPKRLSEIPLDARHNEVEFTYWEPFKRGTSGYFLYTQDGYRYWADVGAIRWLNAAEREGYTPENSVFIVKRTINSVDGLNLSYGFRAIREEESSNNNNTSSDEEMLPAARDAMDLDENEDHGYLHTPHLSDEEKNEYD